MTQDTTLRSWSVVLRTTGRAWWDRANRRKFWYFAGYAGGGVLDEQALGLLRQDVVGICLGSVFLFIGLLASGIAAIRGRGVRFLLWQGLFSAMYGVRILANVPAWFHVLPRSVWPSRPLVISVITYFILIPALLFWLDLSRGKLRRVVQVTLVAAATLAVAGLWSSIVARGTSSLTMCNRLLTIWTVLLLAAVTAVPRLASRFLVVRAWVAAAGALLFAAAVLKLNISDLLHSSSNPFVEPLALAVCILSLGYVAAEKMFADQRRLLSIESELEIARGIQSSILPRSVPQLKNLRITAAYRPMAAVAGDFYEFVAIDENRIGILVADVTGHGVPAALIASMIKVAMQSVVGCASDPAQVMRGLDRVLSGQLQEQFVSAAYLWVDTQQGKALYSAAGHPPLLRWRGGKLERIESNGILFGVVPHSDYPVCEMPISCGDRLLLYTDGVIEAENASGKSFGEAKLEEVVRRNETRGVSELVDQLLAEIRQWLPASKAQQDDITLIAIDVA